MKKIGLIGPILLIVASSCEMVIEVDVPREKPKLVVNCIFNNDSTWSVSVFQSRYILDEYSFQPVEHAQIKIVTETNEEVNFTHKQYDDYKSENTPEVNHQYKLFVSAEGFESVSAVAVVPELVQIINVEIDSTIVDGNGNMPITVTFNDPGNSINTYEAKLFEEIERSYLIWDTQEIIKDTILLVFPLVIDNPSKDERTSIFNDLLFNGKQHTLKSMIPLTTPQGSDYHLLKANVTLINISKEYADYLNTSNLQRNTDGDPFAQPVQVYSNIENGLGIFGGFSTSKYVLKE